MTVGSVVLWAVIMWLWTHIHLSTFEEDLVEMMRTPPIALVSSSVNPIVIICNHSVWEAYEFFCHHCPYVHGRLCPISWFQDQGHPLCTRCVLIRRSAALSRGPPWGSEAKWAAGEISWHGRHGLVKHGLKISWNFTSNNKINKQKVIERS